MNVEEIKNNLRAIKAIGCIQCAGYAQEVLDFLESPSIKSLLEKAPSNITTAPARDARTHEGDNIVNEKYKAGEYKWEPFPEKTPFPENAGLVNEIPTNIQAANPVRVELPKGKWEKFPDNAQTKREEILRQAIQIVTKDRAATHGEPEDSFAWIADYWTSYLKSKSAIRKGIQAEDVAVMMMLMKIARLISSPQHLDNWIDIAGYAACGGEIATKTIP